MTRIAVSMQLNDVRGRLITFNVVGLKDGIVRNGIGCTGVLFNSANLRVSASPRLRVKKRILRGIPGNAARI
jgi:hypothetical protein